MKLTIEQQLGHLPGDILLALAINDATPDRNKKAAVEIMIARGDRQAEHPALAALAREVRADITARHEVIDVVEQAIEEPIHIPAAPPSLRASVTTETL